MSRDSVLDTPTFNLGNIFSNSRAIEHMVRQRTACRKGMSANIGGRTCAKLFNMICAFGNGRCELFCCQSPTCFKLTNCAFLAWVVPDQVMGKKMLELAG